MTRYSTACRNMAPKLVRSAVSLFFEYDTPRIVHIKSKKVGIINRFLQLCVIGYVIGYAIVYKKGYQDFEDVQSAVTTKVKGVAFTNLTDNPGIGTRVWDVADYIVPPQENNAFFVMTNMVITPNQTFSECEEDPGVTDGHCQTDEDCTPNTPVTAGNGYKTGICINSTRNKTQRVCEIYAWCPVEIDQAPKTAVLLESRTFTVFIKNNVEFPKFSVKRRNILGFKSDKALGKCRFSPIDPHNKFCPIFILADIVKFTSQDYAVLALSGGVIQIVITWDCNLDYSVDDCVPEYTFRRLDSDDYKVSKGYNFRYAEHYMEENVRKRTLVKAYGIRFILTVQGRAGKFNVVPLLLNIGSGLALLSIATIVCDVVVLYFLKARTYYRDKKYLTVTGDDAYEPMEEDRFKENKEDNTPSNVNNGK
ncbi:P2X purinoceptor 4-like isoform X1 [Haliotis rufescens]|uniref:P2X purinoceptor 4-like isoform X1 n=1 Tax=Haliotis rufescens TaxID=6454 RepID=UPI00201EFD13|nr:P2X purinoceptor 4-like isoform X1 [Haliotis rufescens]